MSKQIWVNYTIGIGNEILSRLKSRLERRDESLKIFEVRRDDFMKSFIENWELFILYVNYYKFKQIICPKLTIKSKLSTHKINIRVPIIQQTRQDAKFEGNERRGRDKKIAKAKYTSIV